MLLSTSRSSSSTPARESPALSSTPLTRLSALMMQDIFLCLSKVNLRVASCSALLCSRYHLLVTTARALAVEGGSGLGELIPGGGQDQVAQQLPRCPQPRSLPLSQGA